VIIDKGLVQVGLRGTHSKRIDDLHPDSRVGSGAETIASGNRRRKTRRTPDQVADRVEHLVAVGVLQTK